MRLIRDLSRWWRFIAILVGAILVTGCSGFEGASLRAMSPLAVTQRSGETAPTYDELVGDLETSPTPAPTAPGSTPKPSPSATPVNWWGPMPGPEKPVTVTPKMRTKCEIGELDLIDAASRCSLSSDLILTVSRNGTETVLHRTRLSSGRFPSEELLRSFGAAIPGDTWIDVFLCIDANGNGRCADEPIQDLNALSGELLVFYFRAGVLNGPGLVGSQLCDQLNRGALFYHSQQFAPDNSTNGILGLDSVRAARVAAQRILRNVGSSRISASGSRLDIPIPLVRYDATTCPQPQQRTDGCFAKGTKINVTKKDAIAIEKLPPGSPVLLADGRTVRIKKVVAGPEPEPVIAFETKSGSKLTVTSLHPVMTSQGVKLAKDIAIADELKSVDGKWVPIVSIGRKEYSGDVYNLELEGESEVDHLIIAEGLVSGDLYLQSKLSGRIKITAVPKGKGP